MNRQIILRFLNALEFNGNRISRPTVYIKNHFCTNTEVPGGLGNNKQLVPASINHKELVNPAEHSPSVLDECTEDVSSYATNFPISYNIAAYVNKSETLQQLLNLGVNLDKIDRTRDGPETILPLDFERDMKKHIQFLHDSGVSPEDLGSFITKNPFIFKEDLDTLQIRINYLEAKLFTPSAISRIITKNPVLLSKNTLQIDHNLGFLQSLFALTGQEVRHVVVKMPKIATYSLQHIEKSKFSVIEEMGFTEQESKIILLNKPKIYTMRRGDVVARFSYVHNEMGLSHDHILSQVDILTIREARIKERHMFLKSIGRAQYDPKLPNYVSLKALVSDTDTNFCTEVAKSNIMIYNMFLKTL